MRIVIVATMLTVASFAGAEAAPARHRGAAAGVPHIVVTPHHRRSVRVTPVPHWWSYHRECSFHLVREVRASGTYVVPREHCWWVPHPPPD